MKSSTFPATLSCHFSQSSQSHNGKTSVPSSTDRVGNTILARNLLDVTINIDAVLDETRVSHDLRRIEFGSAVKQKQNLPTLPDFKF